MAAQAKRRKTARKPAAKLRKAAGRPVAAKRKAGRKPAAKARRSAMLTTGIGGAFDVIAGRKPDPDGPWRPGTGWAQSTGPNPFSQWLKARGPRKRS